MIIKEIVGFALILKMQKLWAIAGDTQSRLQSTGMIGVASLKRLSS
jgi:hypothetical protein